MVISAKIINRYRELKAEASDCLLLLQVGAFMQVHDADARAVSQHKRPNNNGAHDTTMHTLLRHAAKTKR